MKEDTDKGIGIGIYVIMTYFLLTANVAGILIFSVIITFFAILREEQMSDK